MMKHFFLTPDRRLLSRWAEAFPDAVALVTVPESIASSDERMLWFSTRLPGWHAMLLQQQGVAGVRSVVISDHPAQAEGLHALEAGARGYCHAYATPEMLREVAVVIQHGGLWVGPELMARAIRAASTAGATQGLPRSPFLARLTERESAVALAVARGLTNKEVAASLAITERTVKAHLSAVFEKLGVRDRMQLALSLSANGDTTSV